MSGESDLSQFEIAILKSIHRGKRSVREISRDTGLPEIIVHVLIEKLNNKGFLKGTEPQKIPDIAYTPQETTDSIDIAIKFLDVIILAITIIFAVFALDYAGII